MAAFQLAWPAFAYSIKDDREAKRTYSYVLTYLLFIMCWVSLALGVLAPWLVRFLATGQLPRARPTRCRCSASRPPPTRATRVLAIGIGRARQTQFNWIVAGAAAP